MEDKTGDKDGNTANDEKKKPDRTLDDELLYLSSNTFELDSIDNIEDAHCWGVLPDGFVVENAIWEDEADIGVFFVGVNLFVGEQWEDLQSVFGVAVDVAGILDGGGAGDVAGEEKTGYIGANDFTLANGGAGDFGVDGIANGDRFLDIDAAIFGNFFTI